MMRPGRFCSTIHRLAARVRRNVPRRFTASTRSHTIGSRSHTRPIAPVPAELRRMSSRPKRATVSATARSQSPASLTSPAMVASASRPSAAAVSSRRSGLWPKTATRAPAATQAAAAARPIPDAPPLSSATLPAKLQVMSAMACVYSSRARACQPGAPPLQCPAMVIRPGVSAIILTGEGLLLQRRSDNRLWGLPGGGVEPGESVTEAVVREVREETGLEVVPLRLIGVYSSPEHGQIVTYPDGNVIHYVSSSFECRITGGALACGPESLACEWFPPDRLPPGLMPIARIRITDALACEVRAFIR